MLIEIAIGDAYGAGFEFRKPGSDFTNDLSGYIRHPLHDMPPGSYTDDTQMSIAVAEAMLETRGLLTRHALAHSFVRAFKRDPRLGYARRFREFLLTVRDGSDFLARINPSSDRSGAAMRACPIGLYPDEMIVMAIAEMQARLTHDNDKGVEAAQAAALTTHYFRYRRGAKEGLGAYLAKYLGPFWLGDHTGPVGELGVEVVRASVTAIRMSSSLSELLRNSVAFTGDVDSVAAIAMGAASFSDEIARDIPDVLVAGLEDGPWGRTRLREMDAALLSLKLPGTPPDLLGQ